LERIAGLYRQHGMAAEALQACQRSIVLHDRLGNFSAAATTLRDMSDLYAQLGDYQDANDMAQRSVAVCERLGDMDATASSLSAACRALMAMRMYVEALAGLNKVLYMREKQNNAKEVALCLVQIGTVQMLLGSLSGAEAAFTRAIALFNALGDRASLAEACYEAGVVAARQERESIALERLRLALQIREELGMLAETGEIVTAIADVYQSQGNHDAARKLLEQALPRMESQNNRRPLAATLMLLGKSRAAQGMLAIAVSNLSRALGIYAELGDEGSQARVLSELGKTYEGQKRLDEAVDHYQRALQLRRRSEDRIGLAEALANCANVLDLKGETDEARELFNQSLEIVAEVGDHGARAHAFFVAARLLWRHGDRARSVEYLEKEVAECRAAGMRRETIRELDRLAASYVEIGQPEKAKAAKSEADVLRAQALTA
jgi:tetratricopeptide (TPR) repeat protein